MLNKWGVFGDDCAVCGGVMRLDRHDWLRRCGGCGVLNAAFEIAIPDRPRAGGLDETLREDGLAALRERNNAVLLATLETLAPAPATLLDVGCGPGFLLGAARTRGYAAEGVEPDANTAPAAAAGGARVRHGYFPDAVGDAERFGAIVFNDVLEHIPSLSTALAAAVEHLEPGGVLVLNCPDRRGLFFRVADLADRMGLSGAYDRLWQRGLPSPHVWYFTPDNLAHAAQRAGLREVARRRLETVALRGLWSRIRCVRGQPLAVSVAAWLFAVATWPLARLAPADSVAVFFRK